MLTVLDDVELVVPAPLAAVPFTVTAPPVGGVVSTFTMVEMLEVPPALSVPVSTNW